MTSRLWTTAQVAEHYRLASRAVARSMLARANVEAVGRDVTTGAKLYDPEHIRAAVKSRPGRGARTDIERIAEKR